MIHVLGDDDDQRSSHIRWLLNWFVAMSVLHNRMMYFDCKNMWMWIWGGLTEWMYLKYFNPSNSSCNFDSLVHTNWVLTIRRDNLSDFGFLLFSFRIWVCVCLWVRISYIPFICDFVNLMRNVRWWWYVICAFFGFKYLW